MIVLAVGLAGALGAVLRVVTDGFISERVDSDLAWGTFVVNITGSFVLGLLTGIGHYHGIGPIPSALFETGLCGSFTTYSTFSFQTVQLAESGAPGRAALNVTLSLLVGLAAAILGFALVALVW